MDSPYSNLAGEAFWRSAVAEAAQPDVLRGHTPKFRIGADWAVMTAGSCFAQHVSRALGAAGLPVLNTEPAPTGLSSKSAARFGYDVYSARYGNIYTVRQLAQLIDEVETGQLRLRPWKQGDQIFDGLRPSVEPDGLESEQVLAEHRAFHVKAVRAALLEADLFVFTLGLTEAWLGDDNTAYPTAPGVLAEPANGETVRFENLTVDNMCSDLRRAITAMRRMRSDRPLHVLLTVSPVPLTATASGRHVLQANGWSKAALRVVAEMIASEDPMVDYFPSYEVVTSPAAQGRFFAANMRSVTQEGVDCVMRAFLNAHRLRGTAPASAHTYIAHGSGDRPVADVVCEEELLAAFGPPEIPVTREV